MTFSILLLGSHDSLVLSRLEARSTKVSQQACWLKKKKERKEQGGRNKYSNVSHIVKANRAFSNI